MTSQALGMLQKSRPIDRLRYQAKLIFDSFDIDADGEWVDYVHLPEIVRT